MPAPPARRAVDFALLLVRLTLGLTFMAHGAQKLFGLFGGPGIEGTARMVGGLGFHPAIAYALLVAGAEFVGGLMVALGIAAELGALAIIADMGIAIWKVHLKNGFFTQSGGFEYNALIIAVCLALLIAGPGRWSAWRLGRR